LLAKFLCNQFELAAISLVSLESFMDVHEQINFPSPFAPKI